VTPTRHGLPSILLARPLHRRADSANLRCPVAFARGRPAKAEAVVVSGLAPGIDTSTTREQSPAAVAPEARLRRAPDQRSTRQAHFALLRAMTKLVGPSARALLSGHTHSTTPRRGSRPVDPAEAPGAVVWRIL
jgi:hypothetical protein